MSLNTQLDSNVLNSTCQENILGARNFHNLVFDCENLENFCLMKISHYMVHGAILYGNHRLFCCAFDHIVAFKALYC